MWAYRYDRDRIQCRVNDRAAGRQGIGRRPGRRRDDEAVGTGTVQHAAVDTTFQFDHAGDIPFMRQHLIEGMTLIFLGAIVTADNTVEQEAFFEQVFTTEDFLDTGFDGRGQDIGEKAQAAKIDADQRGIAVDEFPGGIEQGTIATNDDSQVAALPDFGPTGDANIALPDHTGAVVIERDIDISVSQKTDQGLDRLAATDAVMFADQSYRLEYIFTHYLGSARKGVVYQPIITKNLPCAGRLRQRHSARLSAMPVGNVIFPLTLIIRNVPL